MAHIPLDPSIFREYDIRGVYPDTLHEQAARLIGGAFGTCVAAGRGRAGRICVGYDGRVSSPSLHRALCEALSACGHDVLDVGLGPSPMLYFAVCALEADAGVMVTGSHNPPDQNGFKFMLGRKPFFGADIQRLRTEGLGGRFTSGAGTLSSVMIGEKYVCALQAAFQPGGRELKVAWDAGNGAAGNVMAHLCTRLSGRHILLNEKVDGAFPAHHPDPTVPKNLEQVIAAVRNERCDLGIAFDGDGDRIGVVDDEGTILWGDQLLIFFAMDVLAAHPGATVIADVKASQTLFDEVARLGGTPLMWKTGHSHIKAKMAETKAPLAGEMSGHMFFADRYYGFDDALYAAVRLISWLSRQDRPLSALRRALPSAVSTPELRFPCDEARKFAVIGEVKERLRQNGVDFNDVDGVRVRTPAGWWLLRASNTQAMLVARAEAGNALALEALKEDLRRQLALSQVRLPE